MEYDVAMHLKRDMPTDTGDEYDASAALELAHLAAGCLSSEQDPFEADVDNLLLKQDERCRSADRQWEGGPRHLQIGTGRRGTRGSMGRYPTRRPLRHRRQVDLPCSL